MKLNVKLLAAAALVAASSSSFAVVEPGGDLGTLTQYPVQFGGYRSGAERVPQPGDRLFSDDFTFTLSAAGSVIGSVSNFFGDTSFSSVTVTSSGGQSWTKSLTDINDLTFNFSNLAAGSYTLTVDGVFPLGFHAYSGSAYATAPVPEPASMALALAGLGIVAVLSRRRRANNA
jgi:hypothetical protein